MPGTVLAPPSQKKLCGTQGAQKEGEGETEMEVKRLLPKTQCRFQPAAWKGTKSWTSFYTEEGFAQ